MVVAKFATTTKHAAMNDKIQTFNVNYYNLDVIISVGYRFKSKEGIIFRKWANNILKQYMPKGYMVYAKRFDIPSIEKITNLLKKQEIYLGIFHLVVMIC